MRNLALCDSKWLKQYNTESELKKYNEQWNDDNISVCIEYQKEMQPLIEEYFPNASTNEAGNTLISQFMIKENDFVLFSIILVLAVELRCYHHLLLFVKFNITSKKH